MKYIMLIMVYTVTKSNKEQNNQFSLPRYPYTRNKAKKVIEKSRECYRHNPQPTPDTKRKRKRIQTSACKINNQMHENYIDQLSLFPK